MRDSSSEEDEPGLFLVLGLALCFFIAERAWSRILAMAEERLGFVGGREGGGGVVLLEKGVGLFIERRVRWRELSWVRVFVRVGSAEEEDDDRVEMAFVEGSRERGRRVNVSSVGTGEEAVAGMAMAKLLGGW